MLTADRKAPMLWTHERYPFLRTKIVELAPTTHRTQKGCSPSAGLATRQIPGVKTFRKGQYAGSGSCPSGRGSDIRVKVVRAA